MIPGDLLSACPYRQFHTLIGLLDSLAALSNSYPNALRAMQGYLFEGTYMDIYLDKRWRERRAHTADSMSWSVVGARAALLACRQMMPGEAIENHSIYSKSTS